MKTENKIKKKKNCLALVAIHMPDCCNKRWKKKKKNNKNNKTGDVDAQTKQTLSIRLDYNLSQKFE